MGRGFIEILTLEGLGIIMKLGVIRFNHRQIIKMTALVVGLIIIVGVLIFIVEKLIYTPKKIIVLGSSTAVGLGASPDQNWTTRYQRYLKSKNADNQLIVLAKGGYTTYHFLPAAKHAPPRPSPDKKRNIHSALTLQPDAIIINLPSNDTTIGVPPETQLENFQQLVKEANKHQIPVWIATPQPVNYQQEKSIQMQKQVKNQILQQYGDKAIDFWSGLASENGKLKPAYNSGDGLHLNDAGHALLFKRVVDKNILKKLQ